MRVTFINPPSGLCPGFYELPLNISYLAACTRAMGLHVDFDLIDMELHTDRAWEYLDEASTRSSPDVIAAPLYTYSLAACLRSVEKLKRAHPDAIVVVGGPHATLAPTDVIAHEFVDIVVVGEGDDSFPEIIAELERGRKGFWERLKSHNGIVFKDRPHAKGNCEPDDRLLKKTLVKKDRRPRIRELDRIPLATDAYDLFDLKAIAEISGFVPVMSSRGCAYACIFCSSGDLWDHRMSFRTPQNIREELLAIRDHGFRVVNFRDDLFTIRRRRTIEIAKILGALGFTWGCETRVDAVDEELLKIMLDNGLYTIRFGVESFHQKTLELLKRQQTVQDVHRTLELCGRLGVPEVRNSFIIGLPGETEGEILETLRIARSYEFTRNRFWAFTPVIGTEAHDRMDELGITWARNQNEANSGECFIETTFLSNATIASLIHLAHQEFGSPRTLVHRDLQIKPERAAAALNARRVNAHA